MRPDRELFLRFAEQVRGDLAVKEAVERGRLGEAVRLVKNRYEDKPEDYVTPEKIAIAEKLDRRLDMREVVQRIFGQVDRFKNRDELLSEEAQKFIAVAPLDADEAHRAAVGFRGYIDDEPIRDIIAQREFARLADNPILSTEYWMSLREPTRSAIIQYVQDYVLLDRFKRPQSPTPANK